MMEIKKFVELMTGEFDNKERQHERTPHCS